MHPCVCEAIRHAVPTITLSIGCARDAACQAACRCPAPSMHVDACRLCVMGPTTRTSRPGAAFTTVALALAAVFALLEGVDGERVVVHGMGRD